VAQPAAGAVLSSLCLGAAVWAQPLSTGSASAEESARLAVTAAKERVEVAEAVVADKKAALREHEEAHETKGSLGRKQRRIATRILRPHIIAGTAAGFADTDEGGTDEVASWGQYWARQLSAEKQTELVEEINAAFEAAKRPEPRFSVAHLGDIAARMSMGVVLEKAVAEQHTATHRLLQAQRGLRPRGAGRLANCALVLCLGTVSVAFALCCVLQGGKSLETPQAERLEKAANLLLLLLQIPPLAILGLFVLRPLPADCHRAHAARRATQFVPRVAPEPESEDESHPATPVDDGAKSEEEIWPEKDEDTDMSRSRRMMEDAFRSLPGMRGKAADKYITTRAA
jgi:hypothetical protein